MIEAPQFVFTEGPCPPGYNRVYVDAVDRAGRFTAGFSYCERRGPERPEPPHEEERKDDHDRPPEP